MRARFVRELAWPHTSTVAKPKTTGARRLALGIARACTVLAALGTVFGLLGALWWGFDLASHFQIYYLAGAGIAVLLGFITRKRGWTLLAASIVVYSLTALMHFWSGEPAVLAAEQPRLKVVHFNLLTSNARKAEVVRWLAGRDADILLLQEVNEAWLKALEDGLEGFELEHADARSDNFGVALFVRKKARKHHLTRIKVDPVQLDESRPEGVPAIAMRARFDDRDMALLSVHTLPPISEEYAATRHRQLIGTATWTMKQRSEGRAPLVVGDLNATPFCADFDIVRGAGLLDSSRGFGYAGSFPAYLPSFAGLPIDHALHDVAWVVAERSLGPELGSDHRPLEVVVAWRDAGDPKK
jgi:endonuclease/exonuclease/phosphatase (EEP) superfamily protein YafD